MFSPPPGLDLGTPWPLAGLVADPGFVEDLIATREAGARRLAPYRARLEDLWPGQGSAPEGLALGSRDALNGWVTELVEVTLGGGAPDRAGSI